MDENLMREYKSSTDENDKTTEKKDIQDKKEGKKKLRFNVFWIVLAAIFVWVLVSNRLPGVANNIVFKIVINLLIGLPFIIYAVVKKENAFIPLRVSLVLLGLSWFVPFFVDSYRVYLIVDIAVLSMTAIVIGLSFLSAFGEYKKSRVRETAVMGFAINFILLFSDTRSYNYLSGKMVLWLPALIGGALFAGITALLIFTGKVSLNVKRKAEKGTAVAIAGFFVFALIWCSAQHLNYALDDSEPQKIEQEIIDKKKDTSGDSTDYYLIVEINGKKVEISVGAKDYKNYEKGDTLSFYYCDGAFGEPFYIH